MGTTLANLHILGGDEQQLCALIPRATAGQWSARFVSVYSKEFEPGLCEKTARALSKKLAHPVLLAWIFDSDTVGFAVYQSGKSVVEHVMSPEGYSKMGNIALFCKILGLPAEDVPRLRAVWKKGGAEEQMELTAMLLGLPLRNNCDWLPEKMHVRNTEEVDTWIAERPALPKIKSETKACVVQELMRFRWNYRDRGSQYCSAESYDDDYVYHKVQFWVPTADGTLLPGWSTEEELSFHGSQDRVLGIDTTTGVVVYDSTGLLPEGYKSESQPIFLHDGGLLRKDEPNTEDDEIVTFIRCAPDGCELWRKSGKYQKYVIYECKNNEIIFVSDSSYTPWLERVDGLTGATIETLPQPFGLNVWSKAYHNGYWWIAHDGMFFVNSKWEQQGNFLTKFDSAMRPLAEFPLPTFTQTLFFSPDSVYFYIFFYQKQVMVVNAETLAVENVLKDKSFLGPLGFDSSGRFWLHRDSNTVEAWSADLAKPRARHRLKGQIMGWHVNEQGAMCIVTWSEKEKVLRVYTLA